MKAFIKILTDGETNSIPVHALDLDAVGRLTSDLERAEIDFTLEYQTITEA